MTLLSADSFNRANGAVGSTDGAGSLDPLAWSNAVGTLSVNTNQAANNAGGSAITLLNLSAADVDLTLTIPNVDASNVGAIIFRSNSAGSQYLLFGNWAGTLQLRSDTVNLASAGAATGGDVLRVVANGTSITCYKNGASVITQTFVSYTTNTRHGVRIDGTTQRADDWSASDLTTTTTVTGSQATETDSSTSGALSMLGAVYPAAGDRVLALKTATSDSWYGFLT